MIGDALLTASAFAFIFALADVLLSDDQKRRMDIFTTHLWNKLDDYKSHSLWPVFRSRRFRAVIFLVGMLTPLATIEVSPASPRVRSLPIEFSDVFVVLVIGLIPSLLAISLLIWVTSASGRTIIVIRTVLAVVILILGLLFCMPFLIKLLLVMTARPPPPGGYSFDYGTTGLATFTLMALSAISMATVMALPIIVVQLLRVSIVVGEFIVRRMAEYPKGSILAGSVVAAAAVGLFKALS